MIPEAQDPVGLAETLLDEIAAIRRAARAAGGRPPVYASLTGSQLELLRLVRRRPGISVAEAARVLGLAPNTVSTLVHALTRRRLLLRAVDPEDRRVARLDLTPEMRTSAETWHDRRVALVAAAITGLDGEVRSHLGSALSLLEEVSLHLERAGRPG